MGPSSFSPSSKRSAPILAITPRPALTIASPAPFISASSQSVFANALANGLSSPNKREASYHEQEPSNYPQ